MRQAERLSCLAIPTAPGYKRHSATHPRSAVRNSQRLDWRRVLALVAGVLAGASPAAAAVLNSDQIYRQARPSIVEVRQELKANDGMHTRSTGFLVQNPRRVATNYHAIAKSVFYPEDYRLVVLSGNARRHQVSVVAVDVTNDLAILDISPALDATPLAINPAVPAKGKKGYSIGNSGGFGHSIVEGTLNGEAEQAGLPMIHFSGAINHGMSGGPTLDGTGAVVGINTAIVNDRQLTSFLAPARYLNALIGQAPSTGPPSLDRLKQDMARQFRAYGQQQVRAALQPRPQTGRLGPFTILGQLHPEKECGGDRDDKVGDRFKIYRQSCESAYAAFVLDELSVGLIAVGHYWLHGPGFRPIQMARVQEHKLRELANLEEAPNRELGPWQCRQARLRVADDLPVDLHACRRTLKNLPGLHDYRFRATLLVPGDDALVAAMGAHGFDEANARLLLRALLDALRYRPLAGSGP